MSADIFAPWRQEAACRVDPQRFDVKVIGESGPDRRKRMLGAVEICRQCPVRAECRADVDLKHDVGIRDGHVVSGGALVPVWTWLRFAPKDTKSRMVPREHGTQRGYRQHRERNDMPACEPCLQGNREVNNANAAARRARRAQKRNAS